MTDWSFDMAAAPDADANREREVMLAFTFKGDHAVVFAQQQWFETSNHGVRVQVWVSTFNGERLNPQWIIYAWADRPIPPEPAEAF